MDEYPFIGMSSQLFDVVMLYDYTELHCDLSFLESISRYSRRILLGWSMGVWAAQMMFAGVREFFAERIALNGTLLPINDEYGIPCQIFQATLAAWGEESRQRFYRRMFRDEEHFRRFCQHQPQRTLLVQQKELASLAHQVDNTRLSTSMFSHVCIGMKDRIFPGKNQKKYWQNQPILCTDYCHFPFYTSPSWDTFLLSLKNVSQE